MHARVMDVCVGSRRPSTMNDGVFGVVNVAGVAQPGSNARFRCAAGVMIGVVLGLAHLFAPLLNRAHQNRGLAGAVNQRLVRAGLDCRIGRKACGLHQAHLCQRSPRVRCRISLG